MVSILIPTYNYNVTPLVLALKEQIDALDAISIEILIGDDGSSVPVVDKKILKETSFCTIHTADLNKGRTATRSFLAQKAQYEWLLLLDADVLPQQPDFLLKYVTTINNNSASCIFGGVAYDPSKPEWQQRLRWKYGQKREARNAEQRKANPYFIISQNLAIQKKLFLKLNDIHSNHYGLDLYFSAQLFKNQCVVKHIDNVVIHLGLEDNETFFKKSLLAVETLVHLELKSAIPARFTRLQQRAASLSQLKASSFIKTIVFTFQSPLKRLVTGAAPRLWALDLLKLTHYYQQKQQSRG